MAFKSSDLVPDGIAGFKKAIASALAVAVGLIIDAFADGDISLAEWKHIAIATVAAALGTWAVPNTFAAFKNPDKARQVANTTLPPQAV